MTAQKRRDTECEIAVRSLLHKGGFRYRVDARPVPGFRRRADVVFRSARVAVFIDGCFWHGCPQHFRQPRSNSDWWRAKIERNKQRDEETNAVLEDQGWRVLRFWEHEVPERAAALISAVVNRRLRQREP